MVTRDSPDHRPQITQKQRGKFALKLLADFATSRPTIAARFVVYVNASDDKSKGWYSASKIEGCPKLKIKLSLFQN